MPVLNITTPQGFIILPATATEPERIMVPFSGPELDSMGTLIVLATIGMPALRDAHKGLAERLDEAADELEGA